MTVQTPLYLQDAGYTARQDRQLIAAIFAPGVKAGGSLLVSSSGAALSVNVAAGDCFVAGSQSTNQGVYRCFNDAVASLTFAPATTYPRIDQVVMRVRDSQESGSVDSAVLEVVAGVETSGATIDNRSGAASSLPANSLLLADVQVPVGASPVIPSTNVRDRRTTASFAGGGGPPIGAVMAYVGNGDPGDGVWVVADGRLVDKTTYGTFYARASHAYNGGVDPGSNKVRIPDYRGRSLVGAIDMGGAGAGLSDNVHIQAARGAAGGEVTHILTTAEMPVHAHNAWTRQIGSGGGSNTAFQMRTDAAGTFGDSSHGGTLDGLMGVETTGSGAAHNVVDPYQASSIIVRIA